MKKWVVSFLELVTLSIIAVVISKYRAAVDGKRRGGLLNATVWRTDVILDEKLNMFRQKRGTKNGAH
mgnify:FL=1